MAKFSAVALAAAIICSASAFAPAPIDCRVTRASLSAATLDAPPLSPLTSWGEKLSDIVKVQEEFKKQPLPEFAPTVSAKNLGLNTLEEQLQYVKDNAFNLKMKMQEGGAVIFRDFDLMKTQDGFQEFYKALGMHVCLDPLHSVSARPTVDGQKNSPVYEAVNKESRKNFFIGMHNEFVGTRAPRAAAFVCFKAAEEGGEFLIADGRRMFRDLDPQLLQELYNRQIRYSVMELPFFGWVDNLPEPLQGGAMAVIKGIVSAAINAKVDFDVDLQWGEGGYDQTKMLQARAPSQPPIVVHPVTGEPTWFCNVHSHSSKLRHDRESIYGAERFEDGASQINKSDMFFGDDGDISDEALKHMDEITMKNVKFVKMTEGDVVLLDNYKCMHGRNVFDGTRKHGVAWFEGWDGEEEMKAMAKAETNKPFSIAQ
eukprot:CAMPEP_0202485212 /NCGR_PEP_ID=MMETSP1361-20130828/4106_1 /ASSEMBLY_ACC=CAM_ASM_000849 /TAXON_ID=210615 /ORGANISM="Staurosira complex sp., Strain CCMP2646" /LENGTH=426 /DNA_ID=CAMNT_0049114057 /DNA_START=42 /DNA_END=1322 /DNA_ORIENTATION=-